MKALALLRRIERYLDEAPRANADAVPCGPFTAFVSRGGWPYYARPSLGTRDTINARDVVSVLDQLEQLGQPRCLEWVHESTPSLRAAAVSAGAEVTDHPLLAIAEAPARHDNSTVVRQLLGDDPELPWVEAAIQIGFRQDDTHVGTASVPERDALIRDLDLSTPIRLLDEGLSVLFGAFDPDAGAVGGGSHYPRGHVTEIVGVGVLPAMRRRGIASALTWALTSHALSTGVSTVFMSAGSDKVARIYEGVGFQRIGTACSVG
jgi:ribosomal protein S18 acetylase RimI-like enzyme